MINSENIFINFSNHPSYNWCTEQLEAVHTIFTCEIVDVPFPQICASANEVEIQNLASNCVKTICNYRPSVVMCQGEFGLTFLIVKLLKEKGIRVVYSCSERRTVEKKTDTGALKTSEFKFVRFREY